MKKFFKENWAYMILGVLILALFSLRFYNLTLLPVFADEAIYIRWAQVMKAEETLRFLPLSDGKQPLYMWVVIPFLKFIEDPLVAGRIVSVMSGFGTMIGVGFLSFLLFKSKKVAFAAAAIYAVSPFTFFFDRLSLVDAMLSMFGVWTFVFAYLAFTKERLDFAMIAGFALGGAWLTKSPALFFALMIPFLWIFVKSPKSLFKVIPLTIVMIIIGYGMFNLLRLGPNFRQIGSRNLDYVWPISHILSSPLDPLKPFLDRSREWIVMMGPWAIWILGLFGVLANWRKNRKQLFVLAVWFLGPIIVQSEFAKVLTARYILSSIPFLIIIAASSFTEERKNWVRGLVFILAFFVAQALVFDKWLLVNPEKANLPNSERTGYLQEWTAGQGIKEIADYLRDVEKDLPAGRQVVAGTEGYFGTLPDGLQMYLQDRPSITVIGTGLEFDHLSSQLADSKKFGNRTFLVVNKSRFGRTPESVGFKLVKEFPKAVSPEGTQDSLLLLEVI